MITSPEPKLAKGERKKIKSLEDHCKSLGEKLAKKERELKALQHEHKVAKQQAKQARSHLQEARSEFSERLEQTKATLEADFHEKHEKLRKAKGTDKELDEVKEELQKTLKTVDKIKEKNKDLRSSMHTLKEEHKKRETDLEQEVKKLRLQVARMTTRIDRDLVPEMQRLRLELEIRPASQSELRTRVLDLEKDLKEANEDRERTKPLLEVGIAIRLRFLEQSRQTLQIEEGGDINQLSIREGNQAAHSGNGAADAALFTVGILKENLESGEKSGLAKAFKGLYENMPEYFFKWPELLRRVADSQVTMRVFKKARNGRETRQLREHYKILCQHFADRWNDFLHTKFPFFEKYLRNWYMLDKMEWLTVEIIEFDCQKNGSGYPPNLVSSNFCLLRIAC